jgi:hypothetical protein
MIDLKWLLSEQERYMRGNLLAYEFTSAPFAIILGETHGDKDDKEQRADRELENNVIAKILPEYILVEPSMGAWIFDPNINQVRLRDDEPLDCPEDSKHMNEFLKLDINENYTEPQEAFQSFQNYNGTDIFLDEKDFKLWSIKYKIPLVGCDLGLHVGEFPNPLNEAREEKMGKIISDYANNSSKPIIAIIGRNHLKPSSPIHSILSQEKVGYLILTHIDP